MSFFQTAADDWKVAWHDNGQQTITLQRQTTTKDTSGGPVQTWANVSGAVNVPADVQPAGGSIKKRFAQLGLVVSYTVYLSRDVGARASDRIVFGTRQFSIVEGGYESGEMNGWPAAAHVQEVVGAP